LLEALFLLHGAHNPNLELRLNIWRGIQQFPSNWEEAWAWLFYRKRINAPIELSACAGLDFEQGVSIKLTSPREFEVSFTQDELPLTSSKAKSESESADTRKRVTLNVELSDLIIEYRDSRGQKSTARATFKPDGSIRIDQGRIAGQMSAVFLSAHTRNIKEQAIRFSGLKATGQHVKLVKALHSVESRLQSLDILVFGGEPVIHADTNIGMPVPLPMMGDGFNRIVTIISTIAARPNGLVLIDEIENGLYFSALVNIWAAIMEAAALADVQIFATTHSRECVVAALVAATERGKDELSIKRMQVVDSRIEAIALSQETLAYASENNLEIRK